MTYEHVLEAITQGKRLPMRPAIATLKDTLYARHVIESYRRGEIVAWYEDAAAEEIAFHLWNAWEAGRTKQS